MKEESRVFTNYKAVLEKRPNDALIIDLCGILHITELEILEHAAKSEISRELKFTENNIIIKLDIFTSDDINSKAFFVNLKTRLANSLRRMDGSVGMYDYEEGKQEYFVIIPFG